MASTSRADENGTYSSTDDETNSHRIKRRKGPKACDVCRRKKIRCEPDASGDARRPCVNCAVFKTECTYTYVAKKRKTQQAYIDSLQNRLGKLERLLVTLSPDIDLSKELDDTTATLLSRPRSQPRPPSPLQPVPRPSPGAVVKPSEVVATFTEWRDANNSPEDESEDEMLFIPVNGPEEDPLSRPHRYHGNSSGISLLQKVIGMKRESTEGEGLPKHPFITPVDAWETRIINATHPTFTFPPPSLISHLVSVFFRCINPFLPLLHRPSFEKSLEDQYHERDPGFGAVVLVLCAAASRWSDDTRVLPKDSGEQADATQTWASAGWDFYWQVHQRYRRNPMLPTSVFDLQMMALACIYLQGTSGSSAAWQMAGLGLRLALEAGVHRRKRPGSGGVMEVEMWKRAFWTLVVLDRTGSASLGRPCAIWEEDIDLDLPLEVDDEYLNPEAGFTQPPSKPSRIAYFNSSVKLSQILIGALRTIYPVSKTKSMFRLVGPTWEQDMVAALDSSLNSWVDNIPEHLRWDPNRTTDELTFYQSALLQVTYNYIQIVVHRPYITPSRSRKPSAGALDLAFPSLAICTNAARACSHILDACLKRGTMLVPQLNHCAFTAAVVLLFNVWGMNKPGARVRIDWEKQMQDVHICMRLIKRSVGRWYHATKLGNMLRDLVFVGDLPLPGASPRTCPGPGHSQGQKRTRDEEDTPDLDFRDTATTSPSSGTDYGGTYASESHNPRQDGSPHEQGYSPGRTNNPSQIVNASSFPVPGGIKEDPNAIDHQGVPNLYSEPSSYLDMGEVMFKLPTQQQNSLGQVQYGFGGESTLMHSSFDQRGGASQAQHDIRRQENVPQSNDVLTALDAVFLAGNSSDLSDSVAMDVAETTFAVWGSAPSGFQWDDWQQFTNVVQNAPQETGASTGTGTNTGFGDQPLTWGSY